MIDKLLTEVSAINKKYALINEKTGAYFNIFDITGISSDEVIICKLICELLDSVGSHGQGDAFLRLFIRDVLKLDFTELDYLTARVHREHRTDRRRIDLVIISLKYMIPIEVKIFANDQAGQCFDYTATKSNSDLYFLTLDGRLPGESSADGLRPIIENDEVIGYEGISLLSFSSDIVNWVNKCLALTIKVAPVREVLLQFKDVLNTLTGQKEGGGKMEIVSTILSSPDAMKSALDIENALPEAKSAVMKNLLRELKRLFEKNGGRVFDYDESLIDNYYTSRKLLTPGFSVEIAKLTDDITATLYVEVHWHLYYAFAFAKVDSTGQSSVFLNMKEVKKSHPAEYEAFVSAVENAVGSGEKTDDLIFWDFILDDKRQKYDFKNFSPSCVDLVLNYAERAAKIFDMLDFRKRAITKSLSKRTNLE